MTSHEACCVLNTSATPAELMADIASGLYVTGLIGQGVNGITEAAV